MSTRNDPFGSAMGKYFTRLKYEKLEEGSVENDQEHEKINVVSVLGEINLKLIELKAISSLKPKIMSTIVLLQRVRDAYVEAMHRFAGRVIQLNDGENAHTFKVTFSP